MFLARETKKFRLTSSEGACDDRNFVRGEDRGHVFRNPEAPESKNFLDVGPENPLFGEYRGQYLTVRAFTRKAKEYPGYREKERAR